MENFSVLIVEDDAAMGLHLMLMLREWGSHVLGPLEKGEDVLPACRQQRPDVVLMDIELNGEMDGIEATAQLQQQMPDVLVIFLTSHIEQETFAKAKLLHPAAYLPKPCDRYTLRTAIELALHKHRPAVEAMDAVEEDVLPVQTWTLQTEIFVRSRSRLVKLRIDEISWLGVEDAYTVLGTEKGKFLSATPLRIFEERLPEPFRRVHRSFIVNLRKVEAMEEGEMLVGDKRIPLGRTYRDAVIAYWPIL